MKINDLQTLIDEKAENKFINQWDGRFEGYLEKAPEGSNTDMSTEEVVFAKIKETQEYKDFKELMVKKYAGAISKRIIERACPDEVLHN